MQILVWITRYHLLWDYTPNDSLWDYIFVTRIIPICSMVTVYSPTRLDSFWVNVGKYSSTMVRIWGIGVFGIFAGRREFQEKKWENVKET